MVPTCRTSEPQSFQTLKTNERQQVDSSSLTHHRFFQFLCLSSLQSLFQRQSRNSISPFEPSDFFKSNAVPAPFKLRRKPNCNHRNTRPLPKQITGKTENIRIVMFPAQFGSNFVMAWSRPNAGKFVSNNTRSNTCSANQNTPVCFSRRNRLSNLRCNVRVISVIRKLGIDTQQRMFRQRLEILQNCRPNTQPTMIACQYDLHPFTLSIIVTGIRALTSMWDSLIASFL